MACLSDEKEDSRTYTSKQTEGVTVILGPSNIVMT